MRWAEIRAHYTTLHAAAQAAGLTQKAIAERGGIAGQNSISRLLSNDKLGPSVEIFVRAIEGLGKSVSEFFGELEQQGVVAPESATSRELSIMERLQRIERTLEALGGLGSSSSSLSSSSLPGPGAQAPPGNRDGRPSYDGAALSPSFINHNHIAAALDREQVAAIAQAASESILSTLAQRDAHLANVGPRDGELPVRKSAGRGAHRRQAANPA